MLDKQISWPDINASAEQWFYVKIMKDSLFAIKKTYLLIPWSSVAEVDVA